MKDDVVMLERWPDRRLVGRRFFGDCAFAVGRDCVLSGPEEPDS
jgi:hypothetical protein